MPTYEYRCLSCAHEFEAFQSISADPLTECPKCKKEVKRLISAGGGILFKGNGFYITDYRSQNYQEQAKKDTNSSAPVETKTESKPSESAPAIAPTPPSASEAKTTTTTTATNSN